MAVLIEMVSGIFVFQGSLRTPLYVRTRSKGLHEVAGAVTYRVYACKRRTHDEAIKTSVKKHRGAVNSLESSIRPSIHPIPRYLQSKTAFVFLSTVYRRRQAHDRLNSLTPSSQILSVLRDRLNRALPLLEAGHKTTIAKACITRFSLRQKTKHTNAVKGPSGTKSRQS